MRCVSVTSKPAGPSLVVSSKGGSGRAAPTFNGGPLLAIGGPSASAATRGKPASTWRRFISISFPHVKSGIVFSPCEKWNWRCRQARSAQCKQSSQRASTADLAAYRENVPFSHGFFCEAEFHRLEQLSREKNSEPPLC